MSPAGEPVLTGVTYWSSTLGPYVWHEFDAERVRHDLHSIADSGLRAVRTLLPWDVFMPGASRPEPAALRNLETLLTTAEECGLLVIPVLFAQALADGVFLPTYAIDVDAPRPGVRVVTGGVVQPGGPRDQYTDSRMLDVELRWLEGMLDAFSGNPVVAMWDLGHDPASVMRPRRIDHLRAWTAMLAGRVHEAGERCALTLGAADVTSARGVRLQPVAESVDALGLVVDPRQLHYSGAALDAGAVAFLVQLAMRLAGGTCSMHAHLAPPPGELAAAEAREREVVTRFAGDAVDRLRAAGCSGMHATAWSDTSARVAELAPFDRHPELARSGLLDIHGTPTVFGEAYLRALVQVGDAQTPQPWPDTIDAADYYANLPESIDDLYAAWRRLADD